MIMSGRTLPLTAVVVADTLLTPVRTLKMADL